MSKAASEVDAAVQVDCAILTSELKASEKTVDSLGQQLEAANEHASAGATAKVHQAAGLVGLAALELSLKQADTELSQAGAAVASARADEKHAVSRAEMATQAMEQATLKLNEVRSCHGWLLPLSLQPQSIACTPPPISRPLQTTQTLALTQAKLDGASIETQTLQAKLDKATQQDMPDSATATAEPAAVSIEATQQLEAATETIAGLQASRASVGAPWETVERLWRDRGETVERP